MVFVEPGVLKRKRQKVDLEPKADVLFSLQEQERRSKLSFYLYRWRDLGSA